MAVVFFRSADDIILRGCIRCSFQTSPLAKLTSFLLSPTGRLDLVQDSASLSSPFEGPGVTL